jgi:hypothetical protein
VSLEPRDLEQLRGAGIPSAEAERQLALLQSPPPHTRLARACRVGDGVLRLPERAHAGLVARAERGAADGRLALFVPASGAASRMFESLQKSLDEDCALEAIALQAGAGDRAAGDTLRFLRHWEELAMADELHADLARRGVARAAWAADARPLLEALLRPAGLGYAERPKALIPFHRTGDGVRTALEEHLVEAAAYAADAAGRCRVHFTVSREHLAGVEALLATRRADLETSLRTSFEIGFSHQEHSTDTLAIDLSGRPFRIADGSLLLRPGGHGALLANLQARARAGADVLVIKNIDNVAPDRSRNLTVHWQKVLVGHLLTLRDRLFEILARLGATEIGREDVALAIDFAEQELGYRPSSLVRATPLEERRRILRTRLDRPLRVCAVVPNDGQPGGGPFWVEDPHGEDRPQIVESAQVDPDSESQARSGPRRRTSTRWTSSVRSATPTAGRTTCSAIATRRRCSSPPSRTAGGACARSSTRDSGTAPWRTGTRSSSKRRQRPSPR